MTPSARRLSEAEAGKVMVMCYDFTADVGHDAPERKETRFVAGIAGIIWEQPPSLLFKPG